MAQVLELAALALQAQAGCPVTYSRTSATGEAGAYQVVVEYSEEEVGRQGTGTGARADHRRNHCRGQLRCGRGRGPLREIDEDLRLGPSTGSIVNAAIARGIPYRRLTDGSLVQFGWGAKQRRIQAAEVDTTSAVAESIAQDKDLTKALLQAAGVPVPSGRPVADADDAWAVAQEIGLPVVVKPQDGNQGKGVTVNVVTREHLNAAFKAASDRHGDGREVPAGGDFRLLVVGRKLVAAARRDPPQVIGDGVLSVSELVERINADPRRGDGHATALTRIRSTRSPSTGCGCRAWSPARCRKRAGA
jgi:cyanophycin synthetase